MLTLRRMRIVLAICFVNSIVFFASQALRADPLLATIGLYLSITFLGELKKSTRIIRSDEASRFSAGQISAAAKAKLQTLGLPVSRAGMTIAVIVWQLAAQVGAYLIATIVLTIGSLIFQRFNEILAYIKIFGGLTLAMFVVTLIYMMRYAPSKPKPP